MLKLNITLENAYKERTKAGLKAARARGRKNRKKYDKNILASKSVII